MRVARQLEAWIIAALLSTAGFAAGQPAQPRRPPVVASAPAPNLRVAEGERALARGDAARALELADAAVAARPAGVAARLLAARAHAAREEYEASWAQLDAVLTASPRNVDAGSP